MNRSPLRGLAFVGMLWVESSVVSPSSPIRASGGPIVTMDSELAAAKIPYVVEWVNPYRRHPCLLLLCQAAVGCAPPACVSNSAPVRAKSL